MKTFHHIGLPAPDQQAPIPGESWVASSRAWVSNPAHHPQRIEWIRYPEDTLADSAFQRSPHIAYQVDDLDAAIAGKDVVVPAFELGEPPFARAAFTREDGILIENLQIYPGRTWFNVDDSEGVET